MVTWGRGRAGGWTIEQALREDLGAQPEVRLLSGVHCHPTPAKWPSPVRDTSRCTSPCSFLRAVRAFVTLETGNPGEKEGFQSNEFTPSTDGREPALLGPRTWNQSPARWARPGSEDWVLAGCQLWVGCCISLMPSASLSPSNLTVCLCGAIIARILGIILAFCLPQCLSQCTHREGTPCQFAPALPQAQANP